jgi:micrococcal nuclease
LAIQKKGEKSGSGNMPSLRIFVNCSRLPAAPVFVLVWFLFAGCESEWRPVRVVDGDTVWIKKGFTSKKVRLKGVDAPEIPHPEYGHPTGEFYGYEAKSCLARLLDGNTLRLEFDTPEQIPEYDKYGRILAYIYQGQRLINAELIESGCARAYRRFPHSHLKEFIEIEKEARQKKLGMWTKNPSAKMRKNQ